VNHNIQTETFQSGRKKERIGSLGNTSEEIASLKGIERPGQR